MRKVMGAAVVALTTLGVAAVAVTVESQNAGAATTAVTVAADGSGDVTTVQAAVDKIASGNTAAVTITIKKGTYSGVVSVPSTKPYITFVGATGTASDVVITASRSNSQGYGTAGSATVTLLAKNTTMKNLTVKNGYDESANGYSQAVALNASADRQVFNNIRVIGNQDSLLTWGSTSSVASRQYFVNSYIEGDVDFIFGNGTSVFSGCTIKSLTRGSSTNNGYITAASTYENIKYGLLFVNDTFTTSAPSNTVYLGRPWHPGSVSGYDPSVVIRDSVLGAHIITAGPWTDMSGFSWKDARFYEYNNSGSGATVNSNRPQLSSSSAASYTAAKYLAGSDGWNPI